MRLRRMQSSVNFAPSKLYLRQFCIRGRRKTYVSTSPIRMAVTAVRRITSLRITDEGWSSSGHALLKTPMATTVNDDTEYGIDEIQSMV